MMILGLIMLVSYRQLGGFTIPTLALLSLGACLYAVVRERNLRAIQNRLIHEFVESEHRTKSLADNLDNERDKSQELDVRLQEIGQLYRAISKVNAVGDHERALPAVVDAALELVGGDCGSLMLLDDRRENLVIAYSQGIAEELARAAKRPIGEGVSGWVAKNGEPLLLKGEASDDGRFENTGERVDSIRLSMVVPLGYRGEVLGVLNLGIRSEDGAEGRDTDVDFRLVTLYAQHAAVAVRNVQLESSLVLV